MFLRGTRRGSSELKVIAVLLYAFGLSLRKTPGFFWLLSEPLSKSSVQDWMKKVEAKLSFEPVQSWQRAIAVDESVVKCSGGDHCRCGLLSTRTRGNPSGSVFHSRGQQRTRSGFSVD